MENLMNLCLIINQSNYRYHFIASLRVAILVQPNLAEALSWFRTNNLVVII